MGRRSLQFYRLPYQRKPMYESFQFHILQLAQDVRQLTISQIRQLCKSVVYLSFQEIIEWIVHFIYPNNLNHSVFLQLVVE